MTGKTITPSSVWQGAPLPGERWTAGQLHALRAAGRDPATVSTATVLRTPRYDREN